MCCNWKTRLLIIAGLALLWWWLRQPSPEEHEEAGQAEIKLPEATPKKRFAQRAAAPQPRYKATFTPPPDDLTRIYGIGPKISSALNAAGITTYAQLYETGAGQVGELLDAAGIRLAQPETWMEQARLAAGGDFEMLKKYQDELKAYS